MLSSKTLQELKTMREDAQLSILRIDNELVARERCVEIDARNARTILQRIENTTFHVDYIDGAPAQVAFKPAWIVAFTDMQHHKMYSLHFPSKSGTVVS